MDPDPISRKSSPRQIAMVDEEDDGRIDQPSESSPLLGAGASREGAEDQDHNGNGKRKNSRPYSEDFVGLPWWKTPSVYWLLPPYFLFTLAFGGVLVPKLSLIVDLVCRQYFADKQLLDPHLVVTPIMMGADNPQCDIPGVQKNVAEFTLVLSALTGVLSALTAPKLGQLSDRYGRKRLLVIASFGGIISEVITILAAKFPDAVDYHYLILGAFFDGVTGSFTAGSVLAHSYTSDCTPPSKRGVSIGYLYACLFTGLAFGPLLAGYFVEWTGSLLSIFYLVLGCHFAVIFYFWFFLPESLSKKRQTAAREKHQAEQETLRSAVPNAVARFVGPSLSYIVTDNVNVWLTMALSANPLAPLKILAPSGRRNRGVRKNMIILAVIDTLITSVALGASTVIVLYSRFIFGWGNLEASRFVSIVSLTRVVILLGIFPAVNYLFRIRPLRKQQRESGNPNLHASETNAGADNLDIWTLRIALVSDLMGILGYVFVRREELFILSGVVTAFGGLAGATLQSAITKHVPAERVGSLLGATGLLHALGRVFAPALFNGLYAGTVETFPQAIFVLLASLFGVAVLASMFVKPHVYLEEDGYAAIPVRDEPDPEDDGDNNPPRTPDDVAIRTGARTGEMINDANDL